MTAIISPADAVEEAAIKEAMTMIRDLIDYDRNRGPQTYTSSNGADPDPDMTRRRHNAAKVMCHGFEIAEITRRHNVRDLADTPAPTAKKNSRKTGGK